MRDRDKDAKEIDIVLEHDGVLNPIEVKKTSNPGLGAVDRRVKDFIQWRLI